MPLSVMTIRPPEMMIGASFAKMTIVFESCAQQSHGLPLIFFECFLPCSSVNFSSIVFAKMGKVIRLLTSSMPSVAGTSILSTFRLDKPSAKGERAVV